LKKLVIIAALAAAIAGSSAATSSTAGCVRPTLGSNVPCIGWQR
jgi:hypothetical protein